MREFTVALAGNPNVGKSTVFNALTGMHQHTGNWPGKTVASAEGSFRRGDMLVHLVDLPGTYSLSADSPEEEVTRDYLLSGRAHVTLAVVDATCLQRNLNLVLQIRQITGRLVVCVNLLDEAEKEGVEIDLSALSRLLACPVVGAAARSRRGLTELIDAAAAEAAFHSHVSAVDALYETLAPLLKEREQWELFETAELPLCRVLAEMELAGCRVDKGALASFGEMLSRRAAALEQQIYDLAGESFNINSPKQLGEILFGKLGLPHGKKTKTGWSTNADVLEKLRYEAPIVGAVLEYRQYAKLRSTYADGLLKAMDPDGRIRTSFQMTVTDTGRLSSREPNLQNIPTRTDLGSEIRKMFIPAEGCLLVDADYSQIELRLLACIAGDEAMQQAFRDGRDIHTATAAQVFHVAPEDVTHEMRRRAKAVNFGIVYGISAYSLSQDIGVTVAEAKDYMEAYFASFPGVKAYMEAVVAKARENGYVETLFHRRRDLPELKSSNFNLRSFGERVALNMPIQGTAADLMKLAMVAVRRRLKAEGLRAELVLQVHDELIVECPEAEAETVAKLLAEEMQGVAHLAVPLTAEAHWGRNWLEAKG